MEPTVPPSVNEQVIARRSPKGVNNLLFIIPGFVLFIAAVFGVLSYFNVIKVAPPALFGGAPAAETPAPAPKITELNQNNPPLPIPINSSIVQGVSIYYRIVGKVEEVLPQENGDIRIRIKEGLFTISSKQTVVTEKGKGFAGFSLSEIKAGDNIELIYTVDLRSNQSLVTQAQVERIVNSE